MQIEVHIRNVHNAAQGELAHTSATPLSTSLKLNGPPATGSPELVTIARSTGTPHEPADETNTHSPDATGPRCTTHRGKRTKTSARGAGPVLPKALDHRTGAPPHTEGSGGFRPAQTRGGGRRARGSSTASPNQHAGESREARPPASTAGGRAPTGRKRWGERAQKGPIRIPMQKFHLLKFTQRTSWFSIKDAMRRHRWGRPAQERSRLRRRDHLCRHMTEIGTAVSLGAVQNFESATGRLGCLIDSFIVRARQINNADGQ